jgi:hypothetical protein
MGDRHQARRGAPTQVIEEARRSGSTRETMSCAASISETGISTVSLRWLPEPEDSEPTPAIVTRMRVHRRRRHSRGSTYSMAWTRPGGTVRDSVRSNP